MRPISMTRTAESAQRSCARMVCQIQDQRTAMLEALGSVRRSATICATSTTTSVAAAATAPGIVADAPEAGIAAGTATEATEARPRDRAGAAAVRAGCAAGLGRARTGGAR